MTKKKGDNTGHNVHNETGIMNNDKEHLKIRPVKIPLAFGVFRFCLHKRLKRLLGLREINYSEGKGD